MKKYLLAVLVLLLLTIFSASVYAQVVIPPYAAVNNGTLSIYDSQGTPHTIITSNHIPAAVWNADGSILAFLVMDFDFQTRLGIVTGDTYQSAMLEIPPLMAGFTISWTRDGRILFVGLNPAHDTDSGSGFRADIFAINPQAGAQPQLLGTYEQGVGCGGGSNIPADWAYWDETAGFGGFFLTLAETPYGIVHSMDCGGSSLGLLDPTTGQDTTLASNLAKVVVSPDGGRIAGVEIDYQNRSDSRLMLLNLADSQTTYLATAAEPDQLAWTQDGAGLYYTTRTPAANIIDTLTQPQRINLNQIFGGEITELPAYTAAIHYIDLTSGQDTRIYSGESYAIARLVETTGALYFSEVPNIHAWVNALLAREITLDDFRHAPDYVRPHVMRLDVQDSPEAAFLGWFARFTPVIQ